MLAHFEVLLHVEKFRNLDLFHQGAYSIAARIYGQSSHRAARPVEFLGRPANGDGVDGLNGAFRSEPRAESGAGSTGGINDEDNSFRTTSFYVRYREEVHQVDEAALFHLALPVKP
ncbi:hypothetical protein T484DRAFT_1780424 [Baffinella frigidus]|nr:hypothetical protein T484DRAFT_1780424 [Cryptophyta sp. CCMP2293]